MKYLNAGVRFAAVAVLMMGVAACSTTEETVAVNTSAAAVEPAPSGPTPGSQQDLVVNVGDRIFFATDRSDLSPEARNSLNRQAAWMKLNSAVTVLVEGHADERGTREYNLALGGRRATSVKNYMVAQGIDPSRIRTISYGKERPVALCSNSTCWSQNRRGVTVVNTRAGS